jgi:uncharacterized protein YegP (UPF0339 family)
MSTKTRRPEMPHPRFKISKGNDQQYYYNLTAANAAIILASEGYTTRASAERGIEAVKANAAIDARYERREARDGQLYFVLQAGNGEIVGISETYTSAAAREGGIATVKACAPVAGVEG